MTGARVRAERQRLVASTLSQNSRWGALKGSCLKTTYRGKNRKHSAVHGDAFGPYPNVLMESGALRRATCVLITGPLATEDVYC